MTPARSPIVSWFVVSGTPRGGAPAEVRAQWDGVPLPVREPRPVEGPVPFVGRQVGQPEVRHQIADGVPVRVDDAVRALELFGRPAAAAWWLAHLQAQPWADRLVFRSHEGRLLPHSYAVAVFPDIDGFEDP